MMNLAALGSARAASAGLVGLNELLRQVVVEVSCDQSGAGAGVVVGGAGLVVTAAHCVPRGGTFRVRFQGTWRGADVIAYHPQHDLALLASSAVVGPFLGTRDPESLRPGELLFAHGHPLGVRDALAMGVLHSVARDPRTGDARFIVADVRLAPGNSGGPLVDAEGRLVGINSMVVGGLGVAVPATLAQRFVDRVLTRRAA